MIDSATSQPGRSLETLFQMGRLADLDDGQLLDSFRNRRDDRGSEAFRILVERYGPHGHEHLPVHRRRSQTWPTTRSRPRFWSWSGRPARSASVIRLVPGYTAWPAGSLAAPWLESAVGVNALEATDHLRTCSPGAAPYRHGYRVEPSSALSTRRSTGFPRHSELPFVLCCLHELTYQQAASPARLERAHAPRPAVSRPAAAGAANAGSRVGPRCSRRSRSGGAPCRLALLTSHLPWSIPRSNWFAVSLPSGDIITGAANDLGSSPSLKESSAP